MLFSIRAGVMTVAVATGLAACSASVATPTSLSPVEFHAEATTIADARRSSSLRSDSTNQVQLQLAVTANAASTIEATAFASGSTDTPVLTAKAGSGSLTVSGSFRLQTRLVLSVKDVPAYDGPITGIEDTVIPFSARSTFTPYMVDGEVVTTSAAVTMANLPDTALPANLPGVVKIQVEAGGGVGTELRGSCAAIEGNLAQYTGTLSSSGRLVLKPTVEIDTPQGRLIAVMPAITVSIEASAMPILIGSCTVTFGAPVSEGNRARVGRCEIPTGDGGTTVDATSKDAGAGDGGTTVDASVVKPGTASDCMARAKRDASTANADTYYACCNENSEGRADFEKATQVCTGVLPTCFSYCAGSATLQRSCYASLPFAKTACKTEPCSRFYECMTGGL